MPLATRKGDMSTGHDACTAKPLDEGSNDVFFNGMPAGRKDDKYESHGCETHSSHQDTIKKGSSTVFINGKPAGRKGDPVELGGEVAEGSDNIFIGD